MRSLTAVEIGADTCALARTSVSHADVHLWDASVIDPGAFSDVDAFAAAVRKARRAMKLPRRCRAVVWGLPDGAGRRDPMVAPLIEPLTSAGFKVVRVVTPCNALGALARLRLSRSSGATCWLGINRNGVAIVVVRPGKLLYSHSFAWDSNVGASGSQARLLQRYSLVAFLAPEVRRALATARQKGTPVDGIVTCGNLPDLRSLTMPLIEELDIEVETLDSLEGLAVTPDGADRFTDMASSIRLACAAAFARETRSVDEAKRVRAQRGAQFGWVVWAVAILALVAGAAFAYNAMRRTAAAPPPPPRAAAAAQSGGRAETALPAPAPPSVPSSDPSSLSRPSSSSDPSSVSRPPTSAPAPSSVPSSDARPLSSAPARADKPVATPTANATPPKRGSSSEEKVSVAGTPSVTSPPSPLTDPVPRVTAILVSGDRRFATVGDEGRIVGVGDVIGRRSVVAIDDRTMVLREPSGVQIRVGLGGRIVAVERANR